MKKTLKSERINIPVHLRTQFKIQSSIFCMLQKQAFEFGTTLYEMKFFPRSMRIFYDGAKRANMILMKEIEESLEFVGEGGQEKDFDLKEQLWEASQIFGDILHLMSRSQKDRDVIKDLIESYKNGELKIIDPNTEDYSQEQIIQAS